MAKQFIATTLMDGYADGPHVTEAQTGIANQGLYGPDDYVLDEGKKAEAQILTNNSVRVFDATFVIQGRRDVMAANAYADVTIANGEQGMYRNDIIVRKYEKDEMTEIENTSFDVIKGTPSSGVATDPEIPTGDIRTGATMHNMALYRVKLEGLNIVALEPMFKVLYNMADIKKELESLNGNIPIIVPFTVPAFQASTPSHKIKVDLGVTMQNANYKLSIENQSVKVPYSSYKWLDYTIDAKTVSSVTIGFYNEQSKAIAKTDWALIIFPS